MLIKLEGEINNFASIIFGTVKCFSNFALIKAHTFTHPIYLVNYCETLNIIEEGKGGGRLLLGKFNGF